MARALGAPLVCAQTAPAPIDAPAPIEAPAPSIDAPPPNPDADARALELLAQAKQRFGQGDYAGAVPLLEQAYALTHSPRYLLNLGIAHHYMNECGVALHYYQLYLEQDPAGEGRADAANAVEHLTPICGVRAEPAPAGSSPALSSPAPSSPAPSSPAPSAPPSSSVPAAASASAVEAEPARQPSSRQVLGWSLVGAGAVTAGVAVALGVSALNAKSDRQALQKSVPPGVKWDEFANKGHDAELDHTFHRNQVMAWVFSGAAALLLGSGGALLLSRDEPSVTLSFATDGLPELQYAGRF